MKAIIPSTASEAEGFARFAGIVEGLSSKDGKAKIFAEIAEKFKEIEAVENSARKLNADTQDALRKSEEQERKNTALSVKLKAEKDDAAFVVADAKLKLSDLESKQAQFWNEKTTTEERLNKRERDLEVREKEAEKAVVKAEKTQKIADEKLAEYEAKLSELENITKRK